MMSGRSPLTLYKDWVKSHPSVVQYIDWLLYLGVWSPGRLGGSEATYEMYHSAVGLLSVWHQHILKEASQAKSSSLHFWLDALEQIETLVEIRSMHLEHLGKMSRYGPLAIVETTKAVLKMALWSQYSGHMFLRNTTSPDVQHWESEQGLADVLAAFKRLRSRYSDDASPHTVSTQQQRYDGSCADRGSGEECSAASSSGRSPWTWTRQSRGGQGSRAASSWLAPLSSSVATSSWYCFVQEACSRSSLRGMLTAEPPPTSLHHMGANLVWLAELMHIWRPVIYVMLLKRHGRHSWRPWMSSLAVDLASIYFLQRGKQHMRMSGAARCISPSSSLLSLALIRSLGGQSWSAGEEREIADRQRQLLLYLLRSPALDVLLRTPLASLRMRCAGVPVAGMLTDYLVGCVDTFTEYYTYTSGAS